MSKLRYDIRSGVSKAKTRITMGIAALAVALGGGGGSLALVGAAHAASTTNTTVTPTSAVYDSNNVTGVPGDAAPGFDYGSIASNGIDKTDMYFTPVALFGHSVNLGDIAGMSYWTKKGDTHAVNPADWFVNIYTDPYAGDDSSASWYGDRIGTEPYFADNLNDPANTWNNWTTGGTQNKLLFFESTDGAPGATFGSYTDPDWATFVSGNALSGDPYAGHTVSLFSVQTGSAWANGFEGQIDGLTITLSNGDVANVNFEPDDTVAPDVAITNPLDGDTVSGVVDVRGTITDANPDHYYLRITRDSDNLVVYSHTYYGNPQTFTDYSIYSWNTVGQADGSYTLDLEARDAFNNKDAGSVDMVTVFVNNTPDTKEQCKNGGWTTFYSPTFKNQGQCVSYVNHHDGNGADDTHAH